MHWERCSLNGKFEDQAQQLADFTYNRIMKKEVILRSPVRCGSTIVQMVSGEMGVELKKHHDLDLNEIDARDKQSLQTVYMVRNYEDLAISIGHSILRGKLKGKREFKTEQEINELIHNEIVSNAFNMVRMVHAIPRTKFRLFLNYDEIFPDGLGNYEFLFETLNEFYGLDCRKEVFDSINKKLNLNKLKEATNKIDSFEKVCADFPLHGKHISENPETGKWKKYIPEELHEYYTSEIKKHKST